MALYSTNDNLNWSDYNFEIHTILLWNVLNYVLIEDKFENENFMDKKVTVKSARFTPLENYHIYSMKYNIIASYIVHYIYTGYSHHGVPGSTR